MCFDHPEIDQIFSEMKVLPENIEGLTVSSEARQRIQKEIESSQLSKNEEMIVVPNGDLFYKSLCDVLKQAEEVSIPLLIISLCGLSGRRFTEIANAKSKFEHVPDLKYGCRFTGQLKRNEIVTYLIPLLVSYDAFKKGVLTLREKQGDISSLTNKEVSVRYQGSASRELKRKFPFFNCVHDLRTCYACMSYTGFDWGKVTFNRVAMQILGHLNLSQSLAYNNVRLERFTKRWGSFPSLSHTQCQQ